MLSLWPDNIDKYIVHNQKIIAFISLVAWKVSAISYQMPPKKDAKGGGAAKDKGAKGAKGGKAGGEAAEKGKMPYTSNDSPHSTHSDNE